MHCPECGEILDEAAAMLFELYRVGAYSGVSWVICEPAGHYVGTLPKGVGYRGKAPVSRAKTPAGVLPSMPAAVDDLISTCTSDT